VSDGIVRHVGRSSEEILLQQYQAALAVATARIAELETRLREALKGEKHEGTGHE
jgi:hypothetical protein